MTALGRLDRHRQHRRRGDRHHLRRPGRAVLDLGLRVLRDGDQVLPRPCSASASGSRTDGVVQSGPMYYLRDGLKSPALAWIYALVAGVAALTTTPFTQPNSIAIARQQRVRHPDVDCRASSIAVAHVGGDHRRHQVDRPRRREARAAQGRRSTSSAGWSSSSRSRTACRTSSRMVVHEALTTRSAMGFGVFVAMRYGIARGIYANEAGYGTAAVAYGTARSTQPTQQGLQAVMEVFIVSFVTATISAMTILVSGVAEQSIAAKHAGAAFVTSTAAVAGAFNAGDADLRRLGRRLLRVPLRLHDAHRLGLLRRAVPRVHPRTARDVAVSLDLLPADPVRRRRSSPTSSGPGAT